MAIGIVLLRIRTGMTQGLLNTIFADTVPADLRGTAFDFLNLRSGETLLSLVAQPKPVVTLRDRG